MGKKSIRIICLLLTLLILQLPALQAPAAVPVEGQVIPVTNAGFEELGGDGWAENWTAMNTDTAEFSIDTAEAHTGKNSLHIKGNANDPWVATTVEGILPGCFYELSVFINSYATSSTNRGTGVKLEFYSGKPANADTWVGRSAVKDVYPNGQYFLNTNDVWVEYKNIFMMPEGASVLKIYCRLYGEGEAWFDDVSLKFSGGPEKYTFDTEKVFHYKGETDGDAYVKVNSFYEGKGVAEDTFADFAVCYGDKVCEQAENVPVQNMEARYTYSTAYMEPYEKYTLKCKIKNAKGEVLEEHQQNLYVVDRPSMMSEDGYLMVDGKRFNPITAYHVQVDDYPKAVEGGINTVQIGFGNAVVSNGELREKTMNALRANGLKGIFCLYLDNKNAGHPKNIENTKQIVEMMKDNPSIIAWAVQDEPFLFGDDKERRIHTEEAYLAIRQIDKMRPIYICDKRNEYITNKYCDIMCIDSYGSSGRTTGISEDSIRTYNLTKDKNSFWELANTYNTNGYFPSINDVRNCIYRAFEEGSRGMGYYSFSDAGVSVTELYQLYKWDLWEDFCKFNKEEAPLLFDRFVNGEAIVFNEYDDGYGKDGIESMKWFDWFVGEDMYLVAHNRGREAKEITIPLRSRNGKIIIDGFKAEPLGLTTQKAISGNGELTLSLGREEIALFKIVPDQKVDLSKINDSAFDDLEGYDWAVEAIEALDSQNILNTVAEGKYGPGEAITRLDFVSFLVRSLGLTEEGEAFPDCDAKEIKIARKAGITQGDTDGNFRPSDTITRQDIMTTAARALRVTATEKEIQTFSDWAQVSEYALDAVKCMVQAGVIVGNGDGTLNPLGNATRAEAAVMLNRILNTTFESAGSTPAVPQTPAEIREEITFTEQVDANTLQKWSDAADLLNGLGIGNPEIEKSVTKGDFEGYISNLMGITYDEFSDDLKALTYAGAVEAMVKLLGYEAQAQARGGYMAMAAQLELTSGISAGEYIRGGELAVLLTNAFDIKLAERTAYGDDERYAETDDTLLSLYKDIYKYTGVVDGDRYSGAPVRAGQITIDGVSFTGGEGFLGRRVNAYAKLGDDERNIIYIKPTKGSKATLVDKKDILEANTSLVRFEDENGKETTVSVSGAVLYYNGTKKENWTGIDLLPAMGTVTLVQNFGSDADIVLVESYENRVVQNAYAEEKTVYFKNGAELLLDKELGARFIMDFELADLSEWHVLSVFLREDGSVYKVILSKESATGAPSEISDEGVLIGDSTFRVASGVLGTPLLGETAKFYLDYAGKIAAVDTANVTPEYGYFTAMAAGKGIAGGVSLRIFTKKGEMKVFPVAESVKLNGTPMDAAALLSAPVLLENGETKGQLVIYELNGEEKITELETAQDALGCTNANVPSAFAKVYNTGSEQGGTNHYVGYNMRSLAGKYRISNTTLNFVVPATYSENANDYIVTAGSGRYTHSKYYKNCDIFDWNEDYTVGAIVQTVGSTVRDVASSSPMGVIVSVGDALDAEGMVRKAIRLIGRSGEEVVYYADEDLRILLDNKTLTDVDGGETEVTKEGYVKTLNSDMALSALNRGDVVQFETGGMDGVTITAMRAVLRANSPKVGENGSQGIGASGNYSDRTVAYGPVISTLSDGVALLPGAYERVFLHYNTGSVIAPVIIFDKSEDTMKVTGVDAIREGDMVFCRRTNPYLEFYVVYR